MGTNLQNFQQSIHVKIRVVWKITTSFYKFVTNFIEKKN